MKVLVVDDDREILELPRRLVKDLGCETLLASSGVEVLEILKADRVDVVVTDMDGRTLTMRVKEAYPNVRVVASSGSVLRQGKKWPFDGFVRRPFDLDELRKVLS